MLNRSILTSSEKAISSRFNRLSVNHQIAITNDGKGIAQALVTQLLARGYRAEVVDNIPASSDAIILLDGLRDFAGEEEAIKINQQAFTHAKAVAARFAQKGGLFLSVQDTGGYFGLTPFDPVRRWSAGFAGLAKTVAQEWPKAMCKAVDIEQANQTSAKIAGRLLAEILFEDSAAEIGLPANGKRITLQANAVQLIPEKLAIDKQAVIVVSGGARGVTAACLIALAKRTQARFVLLGRTPLTEEPAELQAYLTEAQLRDYFIKDYQSKKINVNPQQINRQIAAVLANREIKNNLKALADAGSETLYYDVDVLNLEQLQTTLKQVRARWNNITGLVHGAGVLADKLITQKSDEQFNLVFNTKVLGLRNLLAATQQDPLKIICFFSSVAARFGNAGQCDYAMANEVLNKVAQYEQHQRGKQCIVKSINWGPWEGGMVTPQLKAMFAEKGVGVLPLDKGAEFFVNELSAGKEVEIVCDSTLVAAPSKRLLAQTYNVNNNTYPILNSHIIKDKAVLPACLVLEWFMQGAQSLLPAAKIASCDDLKVLKGVILNDFYSVGTALICTAEIIQQTANQSQLALKLTSNAGILHYTAQIIMQSVLHKPAVSPITLTEKIAWPCSIKDIYQTANNGKTAKLFHGKDFQVIHSLEAVSKQGGTGQLIGINKKAWAGEWQTDVAALDGILQLLIVWGIYNINKTTLPIKIAKFVKLAEAAATEYQCIFACEIKDQYRFIAHAVLTTAAGEPYAELTGIEMCAAN